MSATSRARKIQRATGIAFQKCLNIVRGDWVMDPVSPECELPAAVKLAFERLSVSGPVVKETAKHKPCECMTCAP